MENEIVIYQPNNTIHLEVMMEEETVWLTQNQMVELYERDISVISRHIQNVFKDGEVDKESNLHFLQIANSDRPVAFYSLDVIISVGYRVKSKRGVEFRKWANSVLKEYLLKGYAVNQRIDRLERRVSKTEEKIDFFVRTSLPPVEGVFFQGQIFDAYAKFESFIQVKRSRQKVFCIRSVGFSMDQRDFEEFVNLSKHSGSPAKIKPLFCETVRYLAFRTQRTEANPSLSCP